MARYDTSVFSKRYRHIQFEEVILAVGRHTFTRQQMYDQLNNGHVVAAHNVTRTLKRMGVTTGPQILRIPLMDWARVEGFGEACLRILLDLLVYGDFSKGDIERWLTVSLKGEKLVQWTSICHQAAKKARKRGKHVA